MCSSPPAVGGVRGQRQTQQGGGGLQPFCGSAPGRSARRGGVSPVKELAFPLRHSRKFLVAGEKAPRSLDWSRETVETVETANRGTGSGAPLDLQVSGGDVSCGQGWR